MTTFVDTNVLIDLLDEDSEQHEACLMHFEQAQAQGPVIIPDIVYSEFSVGMADQQAVDDAVATLGVTRLHPSDAALFRAGRAYIEYKDLKDGPKLNVLPDFLIGAQAETFPAPLISSDEKRLKGYFPALNLIVPGKPV